MYCTKWNLIIVFFFIVVVMGENIITYNIEVSLKDDKGKYDSWPIIVEYNDPKSFKAGNSSGIERFNCYVQVVLSPGGKLETNKNNAVGFNENGKLGLRPASSSKSSGFSIVGDQLYYEEGNDWTVCPEGEKSTTIYNIEYNSNCTQGYNTTLKIVGTDDVSDDDGSFKSLTTVLAAEQTTTLQNNSFQSFTGLNSTTKSSFAGGAASVISHLFLSALLLIISFL